jgi:hypothetical protein
MQMRNPQIEQDTTIISQPQDIVLLAKQELSDAEHFIHCASGFTCKQTGRDQTQGPCIDRRHLPWAQTKYQRMKQLHDFICNVNGIPITPSSCDIAAQESVVST